MGEQFSTERKEGEPNVFAVVLRSTELDSLRPQIVNEFDPARNLRSPLNTNIGFHLSLYPGRAGVVAEESMPNFLSDLSQQFANTAAVPFTISHVSSTGGGYYGLRIHSPEVDFLHYELMEILTTNRNNEYLPHKAVNEELGAYSQLLQARFGHNRLYNGFIDNKHMTFLYDPTLDALLAENYLAHVSQNLPLGQTFFYDKLEVIVAHPETWKISQTLLTQDLI